MKTHLLIHRIRDEPNYALWWTFGDDEIEQAIKTCRLYGGEIRIEGVEMADDEPLAHPLHEGVEELRVWLTFEYVDHDE